MPIHQGLRIDAVSQLENYVAGLNRGESAPIVLAAGDKDPLLEEPASDDSLLGGSGDTPAKPDGAASDDSDSLLPGDNNDTLLAAPDDGGDDLLQSSGSGDDLLSGNGKSGDDLLNADGGGGRPSAAERRGQPPPARWRRAGNGGRDQEERAGGHAKGRQRGP